MRKFQPQSLSGVESEMGRRLERSAVFSSPNLGDLRDLLWNSLCLQTQFREEPVCPAFLLSSWACRRISGGGGDPSASSGWQSRLAGISRHPSL